VGRSATHDDAERMALYEALLQQRQDMFMPEPISVLSTTAPFGVKPRPSHLTGRSIGRDRKSKMRAPDLRFRRYLICIYQQKNQN
jgi:hypothetical protein